MKAKALQNLRAGALLFDRGLYDAAASRYYYAVFQACVHALEGRGLTPGTTIPGARRWDHPTVRVRAAAVRDRPEDERFFEDLRLLRERADYNPEPIGHGAVESCRREVERFVLDVTA
ncbi:MAG TPA: HEPN domain-containing protein [Planctomycetota bacterium]|nr:HEPN domain-containing protein [Planctomycetota bacterium]